MCPAVRMVLQESQTEVHFRSFETCTLMSVLPKQDFELNTCWDVSQKERPKFLNQGLRESDYEFNFKQRKKIRRTELGYL